MRERLERIWHSILDHIRAEGQDQDPRRNGNREYPEPSPAAAMPSP
jgi:hypothetical protein